MMKIVLSGYFGYDNMGDEAILYSIIEGLKDMKECREIVVFSASPDRTSRRYDVQAVSRSSLFAVISQLHSADLLISGGGSLLQDVTSFYSPLYYLGIMQLGSFLAGRAVFAFQGAGPLESRSIRRLTGFTLKGLDAVSVRDDDSRQLLISLGLDPRRVKRIIDPVFLLTPDSLSSQEGRELGVAVRPWQDDGYLDAVAEGLDRFLEAEEGFSVSFIPLHPDKDLPAAEYVSSNMNSENCSIITPEKHPRDIVNTFAGFDLLLGVRLHSLIFATMTGVPCVGIEYDPKVSSFLSQLERKPAGSTDDITGGDIYEDLSFTWENRREISAGQREYALSSRQRIEEHLEYLVCGEGGS